MQSIFKAGAAKVDITPPLGTFINGDFIIFYARYQHDNLYAKALVLQRGEVEIAIVVVDICAMAKDFTDDLRAAITKQTGIPFNNILISATHTHAAGSVIDVHLSPADLSYRKKLPALVIKAVQDAKQNLRPAQMAFGAVDVPGHVMCRRYFMKDGHKAFNPVTGGYDKVRTNPFGDEAQIDHSAARPDPQVSYLAVQGTDGKWISLLGNYSLHYVGDWPGGTLSSDYFGVFARHLQRKLKTDDDFTGIMSNGTSGDINIVDFLVPGRYPTQHFKKSELIGEDIAEKVFQSLQQAAWETDPALAVQYTEIKVGLRKPASADVEAAKKIIEETAYKDLPIYHDSGKLRDDSMRRAYAREQVLLYEYPDTVLFPLQVLKIGSGLIGGMAGEIFAETGLWLKERNPRNKYFTICLANGLLGYVPPKHEIEKGGYETWRCRTSYLEPDAEEILRNRLIGLIQQFQE